MKQIKYHVLHRTPDLYHALFCCLAASSSHSRSFLAFKDRTCRELLHLRVDQYLSINAQAMGLVSAQIASQACTGCQKRTPPGFPTMSTEVNKILNNLASHPISQVSKQIVTPNPTDEHLTQFMQGPCISGLLHVNTIDECLTY